MKPAFDHLISEARSGAVTPTTFPGWHQKATLALATTQLGTVGKTRFADLKIMVVELPQEHSLAGPETDFQEILDEAVEILQTAQDTPAL